MVFTKGSASSLTRRSLLGGAAAGGLAALVRPGPIGAAPAPMFPLTDVIGAPVIIKAIDVLKVGEDFIIRVTARDGSVGHAVANQHAPYLTQLFKARVVPHFLGKDAREVENLIDGAYLWGRNYKLVGIPLWVCVSWAEFAVLDLLGNIAGKPVGALLGGGKPIRDKVDMYLSSTDRETTPEEEAATFEAAAAKTGARALKFKVGGRMSGGADAAPGRTETIIPLLRKRMGDKFTLYADANGSYDVRQGIEVGRRLEGQGVAIYEEPCPFEDYASTKQVTQALKKIVVAGGEQDTSQYRFADIVNGRVLDMVQPDLSYNGGFVRTTRVARLAAAKKMPISPHCPNGSTMLYTLHFAAYTPNLGPFQEYHLRLVDAPPWYVEDLRLEGGVLKIPTRPGFGFTFDPARLKRAVVV